MVSVVGTERKNVNAMFATLYHPLVFGYSVSDNEASENLKEVLTVQLDVLS